MRTRSLALALVLTCARLTTPALVVAQQQQLPPKVDATTLALSWMIGRFITPVTCIREDGSRIEIEEAVVIRGAPDESGTPTLRATFFGIDVADASHCYNLVSTRVLDRRGNLYLTFRSLNRADLGMADFRHRLQEGKLRYRIQGGRLQEREIGTGGAGPRVIDFDGKGVEMVVSEVRPGSDADKLLARHTPLPEGGPAASPSRPLPRRLVFRIDGPGGFSFTGYFIEDLERWR